MYQVSLERLKRCMERAERGEELTIGFLGGSITQGSLATAEENTYAGRVFSWWQQTYPQARFHYVNGGIGGTTSHYGVARAVTDVLMYQPDFVVVDFSVNDEPDAFFEETFEAVVRRILGWQSEPALLILNNVFYDTGVNAQEYHNRIGAWYQVPYVSVRDTIYQDIRAGKYTREELTPDGLHPNDRGHALVAKLITDYLEQVREQVREQKCMEGAEDGFRDNGKACVLPAAATANAYETAKRLTIRESCPILNGFRADTREKNGHLDHFKNGWIGRRAGDRIQFEIEASCIAVQYRKTIQRPAVKAELVLDGDSEHPVMLDGNFEEDWGDCLYLQTVLHHGEQKIHRVEITVTGASQEDTPFYLMALITD